MIYSVKTGLPVFCNFKINVDSESNDVGAGFVLMLLFWQPCINKFLFHVSAVLDPLFRKQTKHSLHSLPHLHNNSLDSFNPITENLP